MKALRLIFIREVSSIPLVHTFEPNRFDSAPTGIAWFARTTDRGTCLEIG